MDRTLTTGVARERFHPQAFDVHFHLQIEFFRCVRVFRNYHVSIGEGIWNGVGAGTRAFFIHLGGCFNTVEAELSLPDLMLLVH